MDKFEYRVKYISAYDVLNRLNSFDELGKQGWELVSVDDNKAYFKRKKENNEENRS
jgi:hypothetical protein